MDDRREDPTGPLAEAPRLVHEPGCPANWTGDCSCDPTPADDPRKIDPTAEPESPNATPAAGLLGAAIDVHDRDLQTDDTISSLLGEPYGSGRTGDREDSAGNEGPLPDPWPAGRSDGRGGQAWPSDHGEHPAERRRRAGPPDGADARDEGRYVGRLEGCLVSAVILGILVGVILIGVVHAVLPH